MRSWRSLLSSSGEYLSPENALELIKTYHENAGNATNRNIALEWCKNAAKLLRGMKTAVKEVHADSSSKTDGQALRDRITTAYHEHGELLESLGCHDKAEEYYRSAKKWRGRILKSGRTIPYSESSQQVSNISVSTGDSTTGSSTTAQTPMNEESHPGKSAGSSTAVTVPAHIFAVDKRPPVIRCTLPVAHGRITDTRQLARCLGLLKTSSMHSDDDDNEEDPLDEATRYRVIAIKEDPDEQERLRTLVTDVIKAFTHDELKDAKTVAEVMCLAPVLEKNEFRHMFKLFVQGVEHSTLLDIHLLEGLAHLMRGARRRYLQADDLVKVLNLLNTLLQKTHSQSQDHIYQLTVTVALVLDAMADSNVKDVDRQSLHEPLSNYLKDLKASSDPNVVYQAAYAYQAIQYVPDNETLWKAAWRRTTTVVDSVSGLVKAVKAFDLAGFIERLEHIQEGLASAQEILNLAKTAYDGVTTLMQSGQDFRLCLKEGLNFSRKQAWYPALRGADTLIQGGQLAQLRILVCGAPCRRDAAFQWGICQRLGDIAVNPLWDDESRRNAVEFLGEMYRNDTAWGQHVHIKQRILDILMQLAGRLDGAVLCAKSLLSELETDGYVHKKALYQASLREGKSGYPLQVALPPTVSHSLIDRVQNKVDVEADLDKLRRRRLNEPDNTTVYIPPLAKDSLQAPDDALFPLMERTKEFLSGNKKVMLILGDSGAGKSSFNRVLERELWKDYKKKEERIPLYINLPAINKPDRDLVAKQLRKARFKESQIDEMKSYRKFILICDGYDECQQTQNLFASNELNQEGEWDVQMIISCRTEYLSADYRDRFQPIDRNQKAGSSLYQEAVIAPFTKDQIHDYIKTYVSRTREPQWKKLDYIKVVEGIPSLGELIRNPFLLTLALNVLPRLIHPGQRLSHIHISRLELYDQFLEQWLERGKKRLVEKVLTRQERSAFQILSDEGFIQNGLDYLKNLASAIFKEQDGRPIVEYSHSTDAGSWKEAFFGQDDDRARLLRESCPITRHGKQYRFIHRSLLEYGISRAIIDHNSGEGNVEEEMMQPSRRASVSSAFSFEAGVYEVDCATSKDSEPDPTSPLVWGSFVREPSILQFLAERVQQHPPFKQRLFSAINHSKNNKKWRIAAANAITIMVKAMVSFHGVDLRGVRIPGADLSGGQFDSAKLQGADLRKSNLRNIWLRQADLSMAQMAGVQFGEWPYLLEDSGVRSCAYSTDGKSFAVGLHNGEIMVYNTTVWVKSRNLSGHANEVRSVVFSPSGQQVASGGNDRTVRLWDTQTGASGAILSGHTNSVTSVTFSPSGQLIASGSEDNTVRLWVAQTGASCAVLMGHTDSVTSVAFSPSGHQIASGSYDKMVRLWDTQTGVSGAILGGHTSAITCVAFSPSGQQLASGSWDSTVRLWDAQTGTPGAILCGHTVAVTSVAFSPSCQNVASGSYDNKVRLWDAQTGVSGAILGGHTSAVTSVTFSPSGQQVASGSEDNTVRLWNAQPGASCTILNGHTGIVATVAFSPSGQQIASGSWDNTVRLWDTQTGISGVILSGHTNWVTCVVFSPSGQQIASGSWDNTVRLWDTQTGECGASLSGHTSTVTSVAFSPSGQQVASGSNDRTVRLWDTQTGTTGIILRGHTNTVVSVVFSPSGQQIVSGSWDNTVRLWDAQTGTSNAILSGHTNSITSLVFSPSGQQIASGSSDFTVRLWDAQTGAPDGVLSGHTNCVTSVVFSPSGQQIASCSRDHTVRLWDTHTGAPGVILSGHTKRVTNVMFSPSGEQIASSSRDNTVRLWDTNLGRCLAVVEDFHGEVTSISWVANLNGTYFATGCQDRSVRIWRVKKEEELVLVSLHWSSTRDHLALSGTIIHNVEGLSKTNAHLLVQRGAVGKSLAL